MGVVSSKSPLERRNTVLRRSQRKSVHGVKSKTEKITKDIKKFKGIEEDSSYIELRARIETVERELKSQGKNLQPQVRPIYNDSLKRIEACYQLLNDKLQENQDKAPKPEDTTLDDDVFLEETNETELEELKLEEDKVEEKRKTVALKLIQVEPIEASPQLNKRLSVMKIGVPVMPGSMMEALHRKTQDVGAEERIAGIRSEIEKLEDEISQFVGKKHGKYYNKLKEQLESYSNDLRTIPTVDEAIVEQIKLCINYIGSCSSFLNEKAVDDDGESNDGQSGAAVANNNLSPRTMRTTYI